MDLLGKLIHNNALLLIDELLSTYLLTATCEVALWRKVVLKSHFLFQLNF